MSHITFDHKHLDKENPDSTQSDLQHELYTIHTFIHRNKHSFLKGNIYNIYSFTLSNILTSFAEPDAPGSCLVHSGPAFHASVSPQSQNPPPVELCICKKCVFHPWNMHIESKSKIKMSKTSINTYLQNTSHCITNRLATDL